MLLFEEDVDIANAQLATLLKSQQNSFKCHMIMANELSPKENSVVPDERIAIRPCTTDDAEKIIALQNSTFNTSRTMDDWRWNNEENPYYNNLTSVGTYDGEIVCSYSIIGVKLNFLGSPILAGQPTNTIVHKDFRKLGYFQKSVDTSVSLCLEKGVNVKFGFPNEEALPINLGKLQYKNIAVVKNYRFRFRISKRHPALVRQLYSSTIDLKLWFKSQLLQSWIPQDTTISITSTTPSGYDQFWENVRKQEIIAVWKDSEYFRWRYDKNPRFKPIYFSCLENGNITAMAVTIVHDGAGTICELMVKDNNLALAKFLLNRIAVYYKKSGHEAIKFYGHDRGFFETVFSEFTRIPNQDLFLVAKLVDGTDALKKLIYQNISWSITSGDFMF
ncbi:MAG: GNAT family N-acetyltransferase [Candidatus Melainabacteria bacterium]|nr:GNAT family N-acetyltransferase [Candidatus Melainabacteria bacterium]